MDADNTPSKYALKINKFDYTHGVIPVSYKSTWYRAYDSNQKPIMKNIPTYFGDMEVAFLYSKNNENRLLGEFKCKRPLYLMDIRYVMSFLPFLINQNFENLEILKKITIALGLCSFEKQITLLEELNESNPNTNMESSIERMKEFSKSQTFPEWTNPIELRGVRVGITDIDYEVMCWLKLLLEKCVDGIISPMMHSPFHTQHSSSITESCLYQELLLFSPEQVLEHVQDLPKTDKVTYYLPTGNFNDFLQHHENITFSKKPLRLSREMKPQTGGDRDDEKYLTFAKQKEFKEKIDKRRKTWLSDVKRIHKSQMFLKHTEVTFKIVNECRQKT